MRAALFGVYVVGVRVNKLVIAVVILNGVLDFAVLERLFAVNDLGKHGLFVAVKVLHKVLYAAVEPEHVARLSALAVVQKLDLQALVEVRDLAQARAHRIVLKIDRFEYLVVGEERNFGTRLIRPARFGKRLHGHAAVVALTVDLAVLVHLYVQPFRKRVYARNADAVQTARHLVSAAAELAARMELCKNDLDGGHLFFGVNVHGDTSAVVGNGHRAVARDLHDYLIAVSRQSLVDGVIHDLRYKMVQSVLVRRTDIHTGTLAHGFKTFEYLNGTRGIVAAIRLSRHKKPSVNQPNYTFLRFVYIIA